MAQPVTLQRDTSGWFGHPRGLSTLFFTEMWERFSFYGLKALLILFMTATAAEGGLGFSAERAGSVIGSYGFGVYASAIFGGLLADRVLGQYRSVLLGGIIIALGHFSMAFPTVPTFYLGLWLIVIGTGMLKPNATTMVGALYDPDDARRDAGFSIFYVGINVGAFAAPLIVGTLGQKVNWHVGFVCAGVGMTLGLIQYVAGKRRLMPALERLGQTDRHAARPPAAEPWWRFTRDEWGRVAAIAVLFVFSAIFWGAFEQASSSLNLFAERLTRNTAFGYNFPSTWYQSLNSMFMILGLAPLIGWIWVRLGPRQPSSPVKFALGLIFVGLGFVLIVPAAQAAQQGVLVSPWWLIGLYFLHTIGELCLSPVGLSIVTKLAPPRIVGAMMGLWFLSIAFGNKLAGWAGGLFETMSLPKLFGAVALTTIVAAAILLALTRPIQRLMGGVR
ncbi:MAG TPA: peptide MFS transporter [Gemmatimonadales bacterium]|jgi:POT family proton-dependent oligopeptide transporter|nr:peptide MFS transporter [Gemmatimonadales bacterium]